MTFIPATIAAELLEHADGRPVAYIDATGVAVFACQQPDGTYVIDICTRDDTADGRLRLLLDGQPLLDTPGGDRECPAGRTQSEAPPVTAVPDPGADLPMSLGAALAGSRPEITVHQRAAGQRASGPFAARQFIRWLCHLERMLSALHR